MASIAISKTITEIFPYPARDINEKPKNKPSIHSKHIIVGVTLVSAIAIISLIPSLRANENSGSVVEIHPAEQIDYA